jgi:hypothetical protein
MAQCDKGLGMKLVLGIKNGRWTRSTSLTRCLAGMVVIAVGAMLVSACSSSSSSDASGTDGVTLSPASGSTNSMPTWATSTGCPAGYQGSAVFRAVRPDGTTFSISGATNSVTTAFHGTLLGSIAEIEAVSYVTTGDKQKYAIVCFSGPSLTGTYHQEMNLFITYANGTYTTG